MRRSDDEREEPDVDVGVFVVGSSRRWDNVVSNRRDVVTESGRIGMWIVLCIIMVVGCFIAFVITQM